jgi:pimeloyl-ACP methyl ester carboxylesterase
MSGAGTTHRVAARGIDTAYLEAGDRDAPPVVLVHDGGFGSDAELSFGPLVEELAQAHWVLAPDLLGHGATEKVYFFDRSAQAQRIEHVGWFCDAVLGKRAVHFVGCSFGGSMVIHAAVATGGPAWTMASGVSISGTAGLYKIEQRHEWLREFEATPEWARALMALLVEDVTKHEAAVQRRYQNTRAAGHWEALSAPRLRGPATPIASPQFDVLAALSRCETPLLFIEATDDPLVQRGWSSALAGAAANGTRRQVPGRHCPHLDHPALVAEVIRSFHGSLVDRPSTIETAAPSDSR